MLEKQLERLLAGSDPDEIVRALPGLISDRPAKIRIERYVGSQLLSSDRALRHSAAVALYALTHSDLGGSSTAEKHRIASIEPETFERLICAVAVEPSAAVRAEQLWAMVAQSFEGALSVYARLVARLIEAALSATSFGISMETLERLTYGYEQIKRRAPVEDMLENPVPARRDLIGYAATGLPFLSGDPANPVVVLVYNFSLSAWLPPGGHFDPGDTSIPDQTLVRKVREETGADCEILWEGREFSANGASSVRPTPSFVLFEDLRAMNRLPTEVHAFHYDLNYICRIPTESIDKLGSGKLPTIKVPMGSVAAAGTSDRRSRIEALVKEQAPEGTGQQIPPDAVERILISLGILGRHLNPRRRERALDWISKLLEPRREVRSFGQLLRVRVPETTSEPERFLGTSVILHAR